MFARILFATNASPTCDDAARVAFDLAKKYQSKLYLFHIMGLPTRGFSPFIQDVRTGEEETCDQDYMAWVVEEMKITYAKQLADCGNVEVITRIGVPHTEILRLAREVNVDLIVMGAHSRPEETGAARFRSIVGNTMQKVAKFARCPVFIISRPCLTCFWCSSNIVFGTDFSKASDAAFFFAHKVARETGCRLYLFHALDVNPVHPAGLPGQAEIEKALEAARKKIEQRYVSRMDGYDNYQVDVMQGIPYVEILKYARDKKADLIVMAHHARDIDPEKTETGSTLEQVALEAPCPVASVNHADKL